MHCIVEWHIESHKSSKSLLLNTFCEIWPSMFVYCLNNAAAPVMCKCKYLASLCLCLLYACACSYSCVLDRWNGMQRIVCVNERYRIMAKLNTVTSTISKILQWNCQLKQNIHFIYILSEHFVSGNPRMSSNDKASKWASERANEPNGMSEIALKYE